MDCIPELWLSGSEILIWPSLVHQSNNLVSKPTELGRIAMDFPTMKFYLLIVKVWDDLPFLDHSKRFLICRDVETSEAGDSRVASFKM